MFCNSTCLNHTAERIKIKDFTIDDECFNKLQIMIGNDSSDQSTINQLTDNGSKR